ncbi:cupin domain-containing protein [Oceanithermus sp.]|uniref:cupin domain-containing protein n=1 Tax=Oceanithermus sp. TaxID=2268145 RepID=UPI0025EA902D|nr:cupin domain-containing protein [Oceanithermus sp.]
MPKAFSRPDREVAPAPVERARGAYIQVLVGPDEGAPNFFLRKFTLEPGGYIPLHRHAAIEHEQYVLRGRMRLVLDGEAREVGAGDAVFIPAGVAHSYANVGDEPVEFLCIVPKTDDYVTEWLEG